MSQVSGVIKRKSVKGFDFGNQYGFMVGTDWYSIFDTKIKDANTRELVEGLKEGDEVEFEFVDTPNKNKPGAVYHNITGVVKVDRIGPAPDPDKPMSNRVDSDTKIRSMALAYAKDKHIQAGDMDNEAIVETAKRFTDYIMTGE